MKSPYPYAGVLAIIVAVVLVGSIIIIDPFKEPSGDLGRSFIASVHGDMLANGDILGSERFESVAFQVYHYSPVGSTLNVRISNISAIVLFDHEEGWNEEFVLINNTFEIIIDEGMFAGPLRDASFDFRFSSFKMNHEKDANYGADVVLSTIEGNATIALDNEMSEQIFVLDGTVTFDDNVYHLNTSTIQLPDGEVGDVSISGSGMISVYYIPTVSINGSLTLMDVYELDSDLDERQHFRMLSIRDTNITVRTLFEPEYQDHFGESYSPWIMEIQLSEDGEVIAKR